MKEDDVGRIGYLSLEDQAILKALGISGMAPGAEFALREQEAAKAAKQRIEARADGLLALELDDAARETLAGDGADPDGLTFFRDLDKLPPE